MAKILVVDDDSTMLSIITGVLKKSEHDVFTAGDGEEAIEKVVEVEPDLIVSDVEMPHKNGYQLVKELKASQLTKSIPVILVSTLSENEEVVAGLETGADDYLTKPVNPKQLQIKIDRLLAGSAELRALKAQREPAKKGRVIMFFGVKGGVGTSTLAVNAAMHIKNSGKNVCMLETSLDDAYFPALLDANELPAGKNLPQMLRENFLDMDKDILETYLFSHPGTGIKFLSPLSEINEGIGFEDKKIKHIVNLIKSNYEFLIVDAGSKLGSFSLITLHACDMIVLCLTLDFGALYRLKHLYIFLEKAGFDFNKIKVVVNNRDTYLDFKVENVQKEMFFPLLANIQNDEANFIKSLNTGKPYIATFPKARSAQQIVELAEKILQAGS